MREGDIIKWFSAVFDGEWLEVPREVAVPDYVLAESKQWAAELLADGWDPYKGDQEPVHGMYLGQKLSPDKLVTHGEPSDGAVLVETLHHFIVGRPSLGHAAVAPVTRPEALSVMRTDLVPLLGDSASRAVQKAIDAALAVAARETLTGEHPVLLSVSGLGAALLGRRQTFMKQ
jgi:hypothetical protein